MPEVLSHEDARWRTTAYEGFEIHVVALVKGHEDERGQHRELAPSDRFTYVGYVCHPGADPKLPGHTVPFHADGEETFPSAEAAWDEGLHVGRTIVDGTHPDLTVLSLVTSGF
ncbi:hypothetical protein [Trinickia sp. EG282A]|uniref:hypothetical protein n=1 Tax=Trinickia sp. EG282A TaxID=3237013 RepID=UPI0034D2387F